MEGMATFIVMLLAVLALAGTVGYLTVDYLKHKETNTKEFGETQEQISAEKDDRLSNLKFVVDQVNTVNNDIYNTVETDIKTERERVDKLGTTQDKMMSGLDAFLKFGSNVPLPGSTPATNSGYVSLLDLPGHATPDVNLIQHVSLTSGLSIRDIPVPTAGADASGTNRVEICAANSQRCIRIPDAKSGDTVLTSLAEDGFIRMQAKTGFSHPVEFADEAGTTATVKAMHGANNAGYLSIQTDMLAVGGAPNTAPSAGLHLVGKSSGEGAQDVFKVSLGSSDAILVSATGDVVTNAPIKLMNGATTAATLRADADGLTIDTAKVKVTGALEVGGKPVALQAAA